MKKITSYLLVAVMLLALIPFSAFSVSASADVDLWDGTYTPFEYGSGTKDDPYLITTAEELAYFAQSVNSGYSYAGEYIKLETNIKLNDETFTFDADTGLVEVTDGTNVAYIGTGFKGDTSGENTVFDSTPSTAKAWYLSKNDTTQGTYSGKLNTWKGIGQYYNSYYFSGNFDGGNHTISGIYTNEVNSSSTFYFGLFSYTRYATIKNIGVIDSYIYARNPYLQIGGIIGYMLGGTIQNCYIDNSYIYARPSSADSSGTSAYHYSEYGVGGIVGGGAGNFYNCFNGAVVYGNSCSAGGILGSTGGTTNIFDCYNFEKVQSYYGGGILGVAHDGTVKLSNCYNIGSITGSSYTGGIIGTNRSGYSDSSTVSYSNCYYKIGCANYGSKVGQGSGYTADTVTGCKSYTAGNLKKQENFVGFDFDTVWEIDSTSDYPYPTLRGMPFVNVCAHTYEDTVVAPKCNDKGYTLHTCTKCGDKYEDSFVSATGHAYEDSVTAPTCTEQGYTTHTCSACGDSYTDSYITANGHKTNAVVDCDTAKVCSVCGVTVESAKGHSYVDKVTAPTCTEQGYTTHTCSACGDSYNDSYVRSNGHTAGEKADCTHDQICTSCGETLVEALGHTEGEWKIVVEATVGEKGLMERYCDDCDTLLDSKEIPALEEDETYLLGDVNGDTKIDSVDYLLVKRACFKTYALSEDEAVRADVNGDEIIDSTDYLLVKRIAFGTYTIN